MKIVLCPTRTNDQDVYDFKVIKRGDVLTINGVKYDFTPIPEGASLPIEAIDCKWIHGISVDRIEGHIHLTLGFPIFAGHVASENARFPEPLNNPPDGPLEIPR